MMSSDSSNKCFQFAVFIKCGRNLENKKLIGNNAPYVEVTIGDESKRTSSLKDLQNPCWNETLKFALKGNYLPSSIKFEVKDDRTLLPSILLGDYTFNINNEKINSYRSEPEIAPFCTLFDGPITLNGCEQGSLDVQIVYECCNVNWLKAEEATSTSTTTTSNMESNLMYKENQQFGLEQRSGAQLSSENKVKYEEVNKEEYEKIPDIALQKNEVIDDRKDEIKYNKRESHPEVHVLPTLHLKEKPIIVEKEIEYTKPVEVKETIIHKEKPIIIEQPIIKEKHEHYREAPEHIKTKEKIVNERRSEQDVGNLDKEALKQLRAQRKQEFSDTTPIIQHEKEHLQLNKDIREMPTQVREKEVIYQQPVEIEKTNVEKIKPKVHEEVLIQKEHVHQKLAPEVHVQDAQQVYEGDEFYSKETDSNLKMAKTVDASKSEKREVVDATTEDRRQYQ